MSYEINKALADILGLPANTTRAVLFMRANDPPLLRVTTVMTKGDQLKQRTERFYLVPCEKRPK